MSILKCLSALRQNTAAIAMTEFALAAPLFMTVGLYGLELANFAITNMRVSQVAMQIADNASRVGDHSSLSNRKVYEADINDLLLGSNIHAGDGIDLYNYGRVIVSSLEVHPDSPGKSEQQWIHWQRCKGKLEWKPSYGEEGDGEGDPTFKGMGPEDAMVKALPNEAVIYVEIAYTYQPIVTDAFISDRNIQATASFVVRDSRDLAQLYQEDETAPDESATCDKFDSYSDEPKKDEFEEGGWDWYYNDTRAKG